MAASLDSETVERVCKVLQMLQEKLIAAIRACEQRRAETETCIREGRKLFKPWPAKPEPIVEGGEEKRPTETSPKEVGINIAQVVPEPILSECLPQEHGETPNAKVKMGEKEDMELLEKILAKAQQVRDTQAKLEARSTNLKPRKTVKATTKSAGACEVAVSRSSSKQSSARPSTTGSRSTPKVRGPVPRAPMMKSTYTASFTKPTASARLRPPSGTASRTGANYLDSVLKRTAVNPAQCRASQKGQETSKIVNKMVSKAKLSFGDSEMEATSRKAKMVASASVKPLATSKVSSSQVVVDKKEDISAVSLHVDRKHNPAPGQERNTSRITQDKVKQDKTDRSLKTDSAGLPVATGTPTHSEGPEKPQQFNLMTDGSRLAMPNSYRKLKSVHLKLYSQLKNIHSEGDSSRNFLEHFESTFKDYNVKMTHVELEKESKRLLREHDELFEIVASVAQQSAAINDSSPWHEVYSCYCSWQFILTKFKELQKRTQTLLEAEEQLERICPCGNCTMCCKWQNTLKSRAQKHPILPSGNLLLSPWLPSFMGGQKDENITYESVKELKELVRLQHEVQVLSFRLETEQFAGENLLPLMKSMGDHSLFVPLYRSIYGLLCYGNRAFPSMVADSYTEQNG